MNELRKKMNSHGLGLVGYFIDENRGLLSLFALGPKNSRTALVLVAWKLCCSATLEFLMVRYSLLCDCCLTS
jgi:hypothetical protein